MAAAYNKLEHFLGTMDKQNASTVMKSFVIHLENAGEEEAVDVADSYSSIVEKSPVLARYILGEVKWNYEKNVAAREQKRDHHLQSAADPVRIGRYGQSYRPFGGAGYPSHLYGRSQSLIDDSGRVVEQVFFYGDKDKDGQNSYADFMALFRPIYPPPKGMVRPGWKGGRNGRSPKTRNGRRSPPSRANPCSSSPISRSLGEDDPDAKAQKALGAYLNA